jgi:hypothetical protein
MGSVSLIPLTVRIAPDGYQSVQVRVTNESSIVERYQVLLEGLPLEWLTIPQSAVQLMPNQDTTFNFNVGPLPPSAPAGVYPFRLILRSTSDPRVEGYAYGNLYVQPMANFTVEISPARLKNGGSAQIRLTNSGNIQQRFSVTGEDAEGRVVFGESERSAALEPGAQDQIGLDVHPAARPLTGKAATVPYTVDVRPEHGARQSAQGKLEVTPLIPRWLFTTLLLILATTVGIGACTVTRLTNEVRDEVAAISTTTAVAEQAINATATAYYQNWDSDSDGLTYEEEMALVPSTDPFNPDSDGDTLSDGDEIRYATNPTTVDFDGDSLWDGEEVKCNPNATGPALGQCTSPTSMNTDNDRLLDNVDPSTEYDAPVLDHNERLEDPSFELGSLCWTNSATNVQKCELQVPVGWKFMVLDNVPAPENPNGALYAFPEMGPITPNQMSECVDDGTDPICDIFSDEKALKVFKGGLPIRFALYRDIVLPEGAYTFSVNYFADAVEGKDGGGGKIWAAPGAAQLQLCIKSAEYDHINWQEVPIGQVGSAQVNFVVPTTRTVTLYVNVKNPLSLANNGWFFDGWSLEKTQDYDDTLAGRPSEHGCEADMGARLTN